MQTGRVMDRPLLSQVTQEPWGPGPLVRLGVEQRRGPALPHSPLVRHRHWEDRHVS